MKDPLLAPGGDYDEDNSDRYTYASSTPMSGVPAVPPMPPLMGAPGYSSSASSGYSAYNKGPTAPQGGGYGPGKGARGYPPGAGGGY